MTLAGPRPATGPTIRAGTGQRLVDATLPELFLRQVRATPGAPAVVCGTSEVTYADLALRVDRLADGLCRLGVRPGDVVSVAVPRSVELIAVLLAVLDVGAAYLPLDADQPAERVRYLLTDARPRCVVVAGAQPEVDEAAGAHTPLHRLHDLETAGARGTEPTSNGHGPRPADTAYVIYTSGSTGRPKGVAVSHTGIVNHLAWMQRHFGLRADDRVLHKTQLGFDVSVWELFWPLTTGAVLVVAEPGLHKDPAALARLMAEERITTVHFVPSMLDVLLGETSLSDCTSLRRVITSGETLSAGLCRAFQEACDAPLHNLYGPTEAAIDVTSWECPRPLEGEVVPIGRPVDNTGIHVLDEALRPVGPGVTGELCVTGVQLATGYVNSPGLTAERFVACPFGDPGQRMYRTGDLAWWNRDGDLEYLGRSDDQVKINGVRVEVAEVEAALMRHPAVRRAAVVVDGPPDARRLTAQLTLDSRVAPGADRLVRLLELPEESRPRVVTLAPRLPVCVHQESEARFMFREIFEDEVYVQQGVTVPDGGCVLDVGANIGLFTLFVGLQAPDVRVYACEPVPEVFDVLRRNVNLHGVDAVLLPYALADEPRESADFTYYPGVSIISGRYASTAADGAVLSDYLRGELATGGEADTGVGDAVGDLVEDRLRARRLTVPVRTASQIIDEEDIDRVSLLKIDAERSELDVLAGIEDRHWALIDQVCLEVHDSDGRPDRVRALLTAQGFEVRARRPADDNLGDLVTFYAVRPGGASAGAQPRPAARPRSAFLDELLTEIRDKAAQVLPLSMLPSQMTAVSRLPLTANGKLDRARLMTASPATRPESARTATTERERVLCALIAEIVGVSRVQVDDNIFGIGGTSLTAVKLTAAICKRFGVPFKFRMVVDSPTAAGLARRLDELLAVQG
ncbi:methyltransferase, FkbM family/amino acid adenylation domain-containing protein [Streptomyces sp. yr375]|uniref:amino acid adenylation domain-containing protein n=1 Tax=Streptomyces sp. yr375 TaxID=1761906 RepID=UPI0008C5A7D8|nr:amino acid adenylation domain-containing protein [Streptomyces sp. yr375]SES02923.1 methyltransferase, FkbM family/amino acid adenylation domain-containing protein [Streptomyces sp. yr375]